MTSTCSHPHPEHGAARVCSLKLGHDDEHNNGVPEGALLFEVKITATGEVRTADGELVSSSPVDFQTVVMTEDELNRSKEQDQ